MMEFILYSRYGCHLCEDMQQHLEELQLIHAFGFNVIDVDTDEALYNKYNTLVPVLAWGEREICRYYLDQQALLDLVGRS